jgi:hypothetical protein
MFLFSHNSFFPWEGISLSQSKKVRHTTYINIFRICGKKVQPANDGKMRTCDFFLDFTQPDEKVGIITIFFVACTWSACFFDKAGHIGYLKAHLL